MIIAISLIILSCGTRKQHLTINNGTFVFCAGRSVAARSDQHHTLRSATGAGEIGSDCEYRANFHFMSL